MTEQMIYKILSASDWETARQKGISRTALDEGDGYVHLSTRAQVQETLKLHYQGAHQVRLLEYQIHVLETMGNVRWEASRGGQIFPHLYGDLKIKATRRSWILKANSDRIPALPEDL